MRIFEVILGTLILIFAIFIYWTGKNYLVTKEQVIKLLKGVLNNTTDWGEWDNFVHIPIKNDSALEKIRQQLVELECKDYQDPNKEFLFDERGMAEIRKMIAKLDQGKPV